MNFLRDKHLRFATTDPDTESTRSNIIEDILRQVVSGRLTLYLVCLGVFNVLFYMFYVRFL